MTTDATLAARYEPVKPGNLISDPGFISGITGWTAGPGENVSHNASVGRTRPGSLAVNTETGQLVSDARYSVPVTPGRMYEFTAWVMRTVSGISGPRIAFVWLRVNGSTINEVQNPTVTSFTPNVWILVRVSALAPADAATARLEVRHVLPPDGAVMYVDDVHAGLAARGANLIPNPDFEVDASGWTSLDGTLARSTAFKLQGAASLELTHTSGTTSQARVDDLPVTAGVAYMTRVWAFSQAGHQTGIREVNARITYFDAIGTLLQVIIGPSMKLQAATWERLIVSAVAPPNAVTARASVVFENPSIGDKLYLDEAFFGEAGVETTFAGGNAVDGVLTGITSGGQTAAFEGQNVTDGAFAAVGPAALASFEADPGGATLEAIGPAAVAAFEGDTIPPVEGELVAVGPTAFASFTADPARPELRIQPVDVRPRRGSLSTRAMPVRWRDRQ